MEHRKVARDFHYYPRTFTIPSLEQLRTQWATIPYKRLQETIAIEHQYLHFHRFMMENTKHTNLGDSPNVELTLSSQALEPEL